MEKLLLQAQPRELMGRKTKALREDSKIPAVVYGSGIDPKNVTVDRVQFIKTYRKAGSSGLVELEIEGGEKIPVLIQDFQQHPVTDFVTHIDFLALDLNKEVAAVVQLKFVGESFAVKSQGGTLVTNIEELNVSALPTALVSHIDIDISTLATFDDVIRVKDINLPEGVTIEESELERTVANVSAPRIADEPDTVEGGEEAVEAEEGEEGTEGEEGEEKKDGEGETEGSGDEKKEK